MNRHRHGVRPRAQVLAMVWGACTLLVAAPGARGAEYVVVLKEGTEAAAVARAQEVVPTEVFTDAVDGFASVLTESQAAKLAADPRVDAVIPDSTFEFAGQKKTAKPKPKPKPKPTPPSTQLPSSGLQRIGGLESPTADVDEQDERVDADIAIIDSGVDSRHPDLNVRGTVDCGRSGSSAPLGDHGSHVAGIAAAIDNRIGVVGVAPGARIWSVKVVDGAGEIRLSYLVCAAEWVARNSRMIEVANMSIVGNASEQGTCGVRRRRIVDPLHFAICKGVLRGVTYTVAAGNDAQDAANAVPAAYDEVITVSAYSDFDGKPGGLGSNDCFGEPLPEEDDTMAVFSNFGADVDIAAPGVCIESTFPDGAYGVMDGTSQAAPHVAGAAALYKARHPWAPPLLVRYALLERAEPGPLPQDPDTFPEPLLDVRGL